MRKYIIRTSGIILALPILYMASFMTYGFIMDNEHSWDLIYPYIFFGIDIPIFNVIVFIYWFLGVAVAFCVVIMGAFALVICIMGAVFWIAKKVYWMITYKLT